jgi:Flp pilus assembly pilin Flp
MRSFFRKWLRTLGRSEEGQGISEYAVILALALLLVVTTVHVIGANAQHVVDKVNQAFSGPSHPDD